MTDSPQDPKAVVDAAQNDVLGPEAQAASARAQRREHAKAAIKSRQNDKHKFSLEEIAENWIYVTTLKRFYNRLDTDMVLDREAFDAKFADVPKAGKLSGVLLKARKNTIRKIDRVEYRPNEPEFPAEGVWNPWRPSLIVPVKPQPGDLDLFYAHLEYLLPDLDDQEKFLNWMAGVLQNLHVKPRHHMLFTGKHQGTGKSFFSRVFAQLIGESNTENLTQDILGNGFTGWAKRTKVVFVEEIRALDKNSVTKKLHVWASEKRITINEKNLPTWPIKQVIAFWLHSNRGDAMNLDMTDRRYLVLDTKAMPKPNAYYDALYSAHGIDDEQKGLLTADQRRVLGAIMYELLNRDLGVYRISHRAPDTEAKHSMKAASAGDVAQWIVENAGKPPFSYRVFEIEDWITALPQWMQNRGVLNAVKEVARDQFDAEPFGHQIRPAGGRSGNQIRVWVKNAAKLREDGALRGPNVLRMYREDHRLSSPGALDNVVEFPKAVGNPWD